MVFTIYFILGLVIGIIATYLIMRPKGSQAVSQTPEDNGPGLIEEKEDQKAAQLQKLRDYIKATPLDSSASNGAGITNDQVQELLNVSDATATRYLDDMQKEGLLKQIDAGKYTYYKKP